MPLVSKPSASACRAERLAGTRSCPNWRVVRPPSQSEGEGPSAKSSEEVALIVSSKVVGSYISNIPFVNVSRRDVTASDEIAQPLSGIRVYFIVVGASHGVIQPSVGLPVYPCSQTNHAKAIIPPLLAIVPPLVIWLSPPRDICRRPEKTQTRASGVFSNN